MATSPYSNAQKAREALGRRLNDLRESAGLTLREHAELCGWHYSKSSRIENARTPPSPDDIRNWCRACDADSEVDDLLSSLRTAEGMFVEWRRMEQTGLRKAQEAQLHKYQQTNRFRSYGCWYIPGMIQSRDYTLAVLRNIQQRRVPIDDVDAAVDARVQRQRVLHEGRATFAFILEQSVLNTAVADARTMAGQLDLLLTIAALPNVSLGIIPAVPGRGRMPAEDFWIYDRRQVNVELVSGFLTVTQPSEVALYEEAFAEFAAVAVHGTRARHLIETARASID